MISLASQAAARGMAKAALVRDYLWQHVENQSAARDDPAARLIGIYDGRIDEHKSVDTVLYPT